MFFYRAVVFLFLDSISFVLAENAYIGLEQLVTNLVTIDNTDLVLISDFTTESQVCMFTYKFLPDYIWLTLEFSDWNKYYSSSEIRGLCST